MNRGHNGLRASFDGIDRILQSGRLGRFAELRDIGARHESAAPAREYADFDAGIGEQVFYALDDCLAHTEADGIHRRIVDPNDADFAALFKTTLHELLP